MRANKNWVSLKLIEGKNDNHRDGVLERIHFKIIFVPDQPFPFISLRGLKTFIQMTLCLDLEL